MLNKETDAILTRSEKFGWVLEPEAKQLLALAGLDTPRFKWALSADEAVVFAHSVGFPVAAKLVSPQALHKSELNGVVLGIDTDAQLKETYTRFSEFPQSRGMLVEEMVNGVELIIGAKVDYQFGPVILMGIGGTGVEIYQDTVLKMAPLQETDVAQMIQKLKGRALIEGHRGAEPVNIAELIRMLMSFSELVMALEDRFESVDLNPVMASSKRCVVADARIMLKPDFLKNLTLLLKSYEKPNLSIL